MLNSRLVDCERPQCKTCGITLRAEETSCPFCPDAHHSDGELSPVSVADSIPARRAKLKRSHTGMLQHLRLKKRGAQKRLQNLKRGRPAKPGEPLCLELFVRDVDHALSALVRQTRGADGRFGEGGLR